MNSSQREDTLFLERMMMLLARGNTTSTYKYALLLALIDLCLEGAGRGVLPSAFTTRQIAERLVMLYWPHTQRYKGVLLCQSHNTAKDREGYASKILTEIKRFQDRTPDPRRARRPDQARLGDPVGYKRLLDKVEWIAVEKPITRLQVLDGAVDPFLYTINFTVLEGGAGRRKPIDPNIGTYATERSLRSPDFDNTLRLVHGVAEHLVHTAAILRPLIQRLWADQVSRYNDRPDHALRDWLFERERIDLSPVREPIWLLQGRRCFYCGAALALKSAQVDHVLPWARTSEDALENLVVADRTCNESKSDFLLGQDHLRPWSQRAASELDRIARDCDWPVERARVRSTARVLYRHLPPNLSLWRGRGVFRRLEAKEQDEILSFLPL